MQLSVLCSLLLTVRWQRNDIISRFSTTRCLISSIHVRNLTRRSKHLLLQLVVYNIAVFSSWLFSSTVWPFIIKYASLCQDTLQTSALALCYSVGEYCAPVWCRSAHTELVDAQLNFTMRLISGTLRPTALPWLPVLANIEPPALRRKAAARVGRFIMTSPTHHYFA